MHEQSLHTARGPGLGAYLNPAAMLRNLWRHRDLTLQLTRRDIAVRYRASQLGLLWAVLTPLILLGIYTFVFAVVFKARWGAADQPETRGQFAMTMFCGMLLFNLFAEVVNRAPGMITSNPNYVKKVVFPLEVFVVSGLLAALFNLAVGLLVWCGGMVLLIGVPPLSVLWLPVVLVPVCLLTAGVAWLLASIGVFVRDVGHAVVLVTQILFFITPVFYRIEAVPPGFQTALRVNPLTHAVEDARCVLMGAAYPGSTGQPHWEWWLASTAGAGLLAVLGYAFFMKSKRAFADVL